MDLITTAQAARILAVSPRTVQRMNDTGTLSPTIRTPAGWLYDRAEVEALADTTRASAS